MNLKKPKFWDYKKPNIFAYLLSPISLFIQFLQSYKKINKKKFKIKTICVGNIYIGGTGKTSLCIKIDKILKNKNIKTCFIKKFYSNQIDEQKILEKNGKLIVSSDRIKALEKAESQNIEVAILDDGLQDRSINYDIEIICFNNINWIGNGMTLPSGPLREKISTLKNYNHIFLNGNLENLEYLKKYIFEINPNLNVHIGKYEPKNLSEFNINEQYFAFSGIGNHKTFISMIKNYGFNIVHDVEYPDHYDYKRNDINEILNISKKLNCKLITTEKDYFRLKKFNLDELKYISSELKIIDEEKFIKLIT